MKIIVENKDEASIIADFIAILESWAASDLLEGGQWGEMIQEYLDESQDIEKVDKMYWKVVAKLFNAKIEVPKLN